MPSIPRFYPGRSSARNPILLCAETVRRAKARLQIHRIFGAIFARKISSPGRITLEISYLGNQTHWTSEQLKPQKVLKYSAKGVRPQKCLSSLKSAVSEQFRAFPADLRNSSTIP